MKWYFSYGSNMLASQMISRTGSASPALPCRLFDYRLAFNKRHLPSHDIGANIVASAGSEVWGVAYRCTQEAIKALDVFENVRQGSYVHQYVDVLLLDGSQLNVLTYIGSANSLCTEAAPAKEYLDRIVHGAQENGLPPSYIKNIIKQSKLDVRYEMQVPMKY